VKPSLVFTPWFMPIARSALKHQLNCFVFESLSMLVYCHILAVVALCWPLKRPLFTVLHSKDGVVGLGHTEAATGEL
jgi:hypothetical protein